MKEIDWVTTLVILVLASLLVATRIYPPAPDDHAEETLLELVRVADQELLACRVSLERELRWRERAAMYLDSAFGGEAIR